MGRPVKIALNGPSEGELYGFSTLVRRRSAKGKRGTKRRCIEANAHLDVDRDLEALGDLTTERKHGEQHQQHQQQAKVKSHPTCAVSVLAYQSS